VTSTRRRVIATLFLIVGAGAIGVALVETWNDSRTGDLVPSWSASLIALGILAVGFVGVAWGWISLFPRSADRIHLARAVYLSQLGKYVPGGVWQPSSQVALARSAGVTLADAAVAFPVSVIAVVAAAATTAGVLLVLPGSPLSGGLRAVVGLGPLALVFLHRSWMAKALELARRRVKRIPDHAVLPQQSQISASAAWQLLAVVGQGLSYAWLIHDLDGSVGLIPATGGFALAWLVGFVAVPIPAGLGLREAVLVGVLGGMTGTQTVLAAAVAHRLVNIACEILMIAGNRLHLAWHTRRRPETKPVTVQPSTAHLMTQARVAQLAYSELMDKMLDEDQRRDKARKILSVITHFRGKDSLDGLRVADIGCSAGFIADELAEAGGRTIGIDIDEPGLAKAAARFGDRVLFLRAEGGRLPFADGSVDVIVFNHIYEHVVDPDAVVGELHRVLSDDGVLYLGLANRLGIVEPHHRLPFLSWLPPSLGDRYVQVTRRGDHYYERLRTRPALRRLVRGFNVWDYTYSIIREPSSFDSDDMVPGPVSSLPTAALKALTPILPTYIWVATNSPAQPAGPTLLAPPERVKVAPTR
jgi:SAM-dependent methyltransferase/uncharacterized membrane protein YbhN (UPF0104 family)